MLLASLNAVFAYIFGAFAYHQVPRGWQYVCAGWLAIQTQAAHDKPKRDIERQRLISEGTRFFLSGIFWLLAGLIAGGFAVLFGYQTLLYSGIL